MCGVGERARSRALDALPLILVALIVWGLIRAPGILVVMPPARQVVTANPKIGIHTRLTDEVETWKIQRSLTMVADMGAPWVVEYFPWAYLEPEQGEFVWAHTDQVLRHAANQGLTIVARLGMVPEWARPSPRLQETSFTYLERAHYEDFARFAVEFLTRYQPTVRHIIVWNEPNLSFEWGYRPVDAAAYTELLCTTYEAVHAAYPDVIVLGGALAPTLEPQDSPAGLNDLQYLSSMYEAGAGLCFDGLAAHAYGLAFSPETEPDPNLINFRRVELLREIMDAHGDLGKPIYVTEAGWNDHPRWTWAVSPRVRIEYTLAAYRWAGEQWPWCPVVAMWMFRTPALLHNYQDAYAFITPDFGVRPIYSAVQAYARENLP